MKIFAGFVFPIVLFLLPTLASASTWQLDPLNSDIQFSVRHIMISNIKGVFRLFNGTFEIDDNDITKSRVTAVIIASSVDTGVQKRDRDLCGYNFLEVGKYPTIAFMSKKITRTGANSFKMTGDLTLHGVTREVLLDMEGLERSLRTTPEE